MRKTFLFFCLMIFSFSFAQEDDIKKVMLPRDDFSFDSGIHLDERFVDLSSGKSQYQILIHSLQSGEISYNVSLNYNGDGVPNQAKALNKYSSTSVLGLGWYLDFPKIIVNNKNTASRHDDKFYFLDQGVQELICTRVTSNIYYFKTANKSLKKILYYPNEEKWEITSSKGNIYTYGGLNLNNGNAINWVLHWGNWIGDSKDSGESRQAYQWNIAKIEDKNTNTIDFDYLKVENSTRLGGLKHTEASYLREVKDDLDNSIYFSYMYKSSTYEPNRQVSEPDAYQEFYENKSLSEIHIKDSGIKKVEYHMNYSENGSGHYLKNLLDRIEVLGDNIESSYIVFTYETDESFKYLLKTIEPQSGGIIEYEYENKSISEDYSFTIDNITGYKRRVIMEDDYALIYYIANSSNNNGPEGYLYRNIKITTITKTGNIWVQEHHFDFEAKFKEAINGWPTYTPLGIPSLGNPENYLFFMQKKFFAILRYQDGEGQLDYFNLNTDGSWEHNFVSNINLGGGKPALIGGEGFFAIGCKKTGLLYIYKWNSQNWESQIIDQNEGDFVYTANNNYIFSNNKNTSTNMITGEENSDNFYIHYLTLNKVFHTNTLPAHLSFNTNGENYLYADNVYIGMMASNHPEYVIRWDESYNIYGVDDFIGSYNDHYRLDMYLGKMVIMVQGGRHSLKMSSFNGNSWARSNIIGHNSENYFPYPNDFFALGNGSALSLKGRGFDNLDYDTIHYDVHSAIYDANNEIWILEQPYTSSGPTNSRYVPIAGINDLFTIKNKVYFKNNLNQLEYLYTINFGGELQRAESNDVNFIKLSGNSNLGVENINVFQTKNGNINHFSIKDSYGRVLLPYSIERNNFLLKKYLNTPEETSVFQESLYPKLNEQYEKIKTIVVSEMSFNDNFHKYYDYEDFYISNDEVRFGQTTITYDLVNSRSDIYKFDKGITDSRRKGILLESLKKNGLGNDMIKQNNILEIDENQIFTFDNNLVKTGFNINNLNSTTYHYEGSESTVESEVEYTYNNIGLVREEKQLSGDKEYKTVYKYPQDLSSQPYMSNLITQNRLSEVIEQEQYVNDQLIGRTVTEYNLFDDVNLVQPYKTRTYNKNNELISTNIVSKYNDRGIPIEQYAEESNIYSSSITAYNNQLVIAKALNAAHNEIFHTSFEQFSDGGVTGKSYTGIKYKNGSYTIPFVKPNSKEYVVSYWEKLSGGEWSFSGYMVYSDNMVIGNTNSMIDEVRVHPRESQMTTTTYSKFCKKPITESDARGNIVRYEYDDLCRLETIKDSDDHILSKNQYHYKGQQ